MNLQSLAQNFSRLDSERPKLDEDFKNWLKQYEVPRVALPSYEVANQSPITQASYVSEQRVSCWWFVLGNDIVGIKNSTDDFGYKIPFGELEEMPNVKFVKVA